MFDAVRTGGLSKGHAVRSFTSRSFRLFSGKTLACQTTFGGYGVVYEVSSAVLFFVRPCLNTSLRGVPQTCVGPAFGLDLPDTDKINSIVPRTS